MYVKPVRDDLGIRDRRCPGAMSRAKQIPLGREGMQEGSRRRLREQRRPRCW